MLAMCSNFANLNLDKKLFAKSPMSIITQSMSEKNITIKKKAFLHDGFLRVARYEMQHQCFDGSWTPLYTRELIIKQQAVGAILYDPKLDRIVLIEQLRAGALNSGTIPWLIEIVAGLMDKTHQESPEDLIRRETREEACLEIEALLPIYNYFTTPGCSTEKLQLFCAKVDSTKAPLFCGLKNEHEDIKIHVVATKEAFLAVHSGQINNAAAIIALQWLELNLEMVNQKWR